MSLSRKWIMVVLMLCAVLGMSGQRKTPTIRQLEQQRKDALAEIEQTKQLLTKTQATTKVSLNRLNLLSQQILSRQKLISLLNQEIGQVDKQISDKQQEIAVLQRELEGKRRSYAKAIKGIHLHHSTQDKLLFIFSADNFSQSLRRMRYLHEYSEWQKRQAGEIARKAEEIRRQQLSLSQIRTDKMTLLGSRETEHQHLQNEQQNKEQEVVSLNKKQKDLKAQIAVKRRQAEVLDRKIEALILEEIRRAEAEAQAAREKAAREKEAREKAAREKAAKESAAANNKKRKETAVKPVETTVKPSSTDRVAEVKGGYAMTQAERQLSVNFGENKGRLPYPVTGSHAIVSSFGEQQHQDLQYVRTVNSGIDIHANPGAEARAVFTGVVTRVFVVPGYNNSVIIRHGNYLTVYCNLSSVYVKAGERVSTRQSLGRIFSDPENANETILTFQIWKERTKLNPAPWLAR